MKKLVIFPVCSVFMVLLAYSHFAAASEGPTIKMQPSVTTLAANDTPVKGHSDSGGKGGKGGNGGAGGAGGAGGSGTQPGKGGTGGKGGAAGPGGTPGADGAPGADGSQVPSGPPDKKTSS
ncbi:hypothetical protein [Pseudomonas coronafaciens]|uniref:hypothetical protein n=1 Tax=Pseudomonas coronafaciens TaxID=53409 RepID=UPI0037BACD17